MTLTVHHLEYSRSLRILWLLEELDLEYGIKTYSRNAEFRAPIEAREVHALGRFPMVEVDGHVLAESGAVIEYFVERENRLIPTSVDDKLEYRFFLHYAEGSAMPPLLIQLILEKLREAPMPFFIKPIAKGIAEKIEAGFSGPAVKLHFDFIDEVLAKRDYFAGDAFSGADIQMFYAVEGALLRAGQSWPNIRAWRERVTARDAYLRAVEKGGTAMPPNA